MAESCHHRLVLVLYSLLFSSIIGFDSPLNHQSHIQLGDLPVHLNGSHDSLFSYLLIPFLSSDLWRYTTFVTHFLRPMQDLVSPRIYTWFPSYGSYLFSKPELLLVSLQLYVPNTCLIISLSLPHLAWIARSMLLHGLNMTLESHTLILLFIPHFYSIILPYSPQASSYFLFLIDSSPPLPQSSMVPLLSSWIL